MRRIFLLIGTVLVLVLVQHGHAQQLPVVNCNGLPGCGAPPSDVLFQNALTTAVIVLVNASAGAAVLFVVISGLQMLLAFGDSGKISKARKGILYALGGLGLSLVAASLVQVVSSEVLVQAGGDVLTDFMASVVRIILTLFNVIFIIVAIGAGIRMVIAQGKSDEFQAGISMIKWAIIGAIIVNVSRAIVLAFLNLNL
jgi:hypothetical protein